MHARLHRPLDPIDRHLIHTVTADAALRIAVPAVRDTGYERSNEALSTTVCRHS